MTVADSAAALAIMHKRAIGADAIAAPVTPERDSSAPPMTPDCEDSGRGKSGGKWQGTEGGASERKGG